MTNVPTTETATAATTTAAPTVSTATGTGAPTTGTAPAAVPVPGGRLGQGELRRRVATVLADRPGNLFSPGEIAKELGRSAGAVANALATLTGRGQAEQVSGRPRRYRATPTTVDATKGSGGAGAARAVRRSAPAAPAAPPSGTTPAPATGPAAGAGAGKAAGKGVSGPVVRPNGQAYHPRALADLPDVAALRRLREASIAALLYGPPGTGKTSLVEAAFPDLITVAGDGDTAVADFIGEYTQAPGGGYEFVYGPLVTAMTEGRCLFIDDATLISPKVLAVVYPAMDGRRQITVKAHKGETITAAEGFYVVAGHNPGVHGAVLTEALASRFAAQIQVSTDYDLATTLKIEPRAIRIARNLARRQASGEIGWAPQLRELIAFQKMTKVLGPDAAVANLVGIAPEEDRDMVAEVISSVYGRAVTPLALGRQL
ncbi:AAA domain-containing protein [Actinomadura sp. LD22]|uniref:AAA domain-containing protein n=1 Tax=Actinomadura physcomitrii TaxID=2650748 RepID=A0A6I4ME07_9ACTN|nr:AAA family ATPase [Actinomadura physcomitrii]MWA02765.1 AAA domain-containing protein [Actinomadura physcomitrii]